ncbi:MAG TPA: hypothetical protein VFT74_04445, partial [Isosphaeraceae bacterium]|nr:hypothetical protein [Isosphaeraceae bacterium]
MKPRCLPQASLPPLVENDAPQVNLPMPSLRGLLAGTLAVGVGLLILLFSQGAVASADLPVLGMLFMGALVGGSAADRMVECRLAAEAPKGWMTVIVSSS